MSAKMAANGIWTQFSDIYRTDKKLMTFCLILIWFGDFIMGWIMGLLAWLFRLEIKLSRYALMLACRLMCYYALQVKSNDYYTCTVHYVWLKLKSDRADGQAVNVRASCAGGLKVWSSNWLQTVCHRFDNYESSCAALKVCSKDGLH